MRMYINLCFSIICTNIIENLSQNLVRGHTPPSTASTGKPKSATPLDVTPHAGHPCRVLKNHCTRSTHTHTHKHNNNNNNKRWTKTTYLRGVAVIMSVVVLLQRRQQTQLPAPSGVAHCLPFILVTRASYTTTYTYIPRTRGRSARAHTPHATWGGRPCRTAAAAVLVTAARCARAISRAEPTEACTHSGHRVRR